MNNMIKFITSSIPLFFGANLAHSQSIAFQCKYSHKDLNFIEGCTLPDYSLAPKQDFHAEVTIGYVFNCHGQPFGGVFAGDDNSVPIQYGNHEMQISKSVSGYGPFAIKDINPKATYDAGFIGQCNIEVKTVSIWPSMHQIKDIWTPAAKHFVDNLDYAIFNLKLASRIESIEDIVEMRSNSLIEILWEQMDEALLENGVSEGIKRFAKNLDKKELLTFAEMKDLGRQDEWETLTSSHTEILNYFITLSTVSALKKQLPPPFEDQAVNEATNASLKSLVNSSADKLKKLCDEAEGFLAMIDKWKEQSNADLNSAKEDLKSILAAAKQKYAASKPNGE